MKNHNILLTISLAIAIGLVTSMQEKVYGQNVANAENDLALLPLSSHSDNIPLEIKLPKDENPNETRGGLKRPINLELAAWYGVTFGDNENQNGLRRFDMKYQRNKENLFFVFYDNALVLDNDAVSAVERIAPIVGAGIKHDWSEKWFTKLELARRFLTTQDDQNIVNLENGYFFTKKFLGKFISQYDARQDDNLLTLGAFIDFEVLRDFRIETGLFHAENLTIAETFNERFMLVPKLKLGKTELVVAAYYDVYRTPDVDIDQFSGGYSLFIFPILKNLKGSLFFNYDKGFRNEITVLSLGVNQKI